MPTYLITDGSYSDYGVKAILEGPAALDFTAIYARVQESFQKARESWPDKEDTYGDSFKRCREEWNTRGYAGHDQQDIFLSVLLKDHGCRRLPYSEVNTDYTDIDLREHPEG